MTPSHALSRTPDLECTMKTRNAIRHDRLGAVAGYTAALFALGATGTGNAQATRAAPSSSLMVGQGPVPPADERVAPHGMRDRSMFAVPPETPRAFRRHDLVQIIVRESSRASSSQETETKKQNRLDASIDAWPDLDLSELLQLRVSAGRTSDLPRVGVRSNRNFKGEGDYERKDDITTRLTAKVIEVLPNGNLVLEARTHLRFDREDTTITVTGVCRPEDVNAANTVVSTSLYDLRVEKTNNGELRQTTEKGLLARVFDFIFAF